MPHASLYFSKKYTHEDVRIFMERLAMIAADFGYLNKAGATAGSRGNIVDFLTAIVNSDIGLSLMLPPDQVLTDLLRERGG